MKLSFLVMVLFLSIGAQAQTCPSEWTRCADETATCTFTGQKLVRYGVPGKYVAKILTGPVACNNTTFGDPAVGVRKSCEISSVPTTVVATPVPTPTPTPQPVLTSLTINTPGQIVRGVKVANPNGNCVTVTAPDVQILDSEIGPCLGRGVMVHNNNFTMQNTYVHDTRNEGVYNYHSDNLKLIGNRFENTSAGARFVESTRVLVQKNHFKNMLGDMKTPGAGMGNMVQFDKVRGAGNAIRCNVGLNEEGKSKVEDNLSVWASSGDVTSPILVEFNKIMGGGPSHSSGGLLLGDGGGANQVARGNLLVNPGQYGIAVAGGQNNKILDNKIFSVQKPWSNVGTYVWDQYNSSCANITVTNNKINWVNKDGAQNAWWFTSTCGEVTKTGNTWGDATVTAAIFNQTIPECN